MFDQRKIATLGVPLVLSLFLLGACNDDDNDGNNGFNNNNARYTLSITNNTANQPMSPPAVILHRDGYHNFIAGEPAGRELEILAEGGDSTALLTAAQGFISYLSSISGSGPIGPGATATLTLETDTSDAQISMASMLVNTNDAFAALDAYDVSSLRAGDSIRVPLHAWDAGTELNTEAAGTIPGPADPSQSGGEGFNGSREGDVDRVAIHAGVVSVDDGLEGSILRQSHRFDNPVAHIMITRTQ